MRKKMGFLFLAVLTVSSIGFAQMGTQNQGGVTLPAPPEAAPTLGGVPPAGVPPAETPPAGSPSVPTLTPPPTSETPTSATPEAAAEETTPGEEEMVYLNVQDQDIKEVIKQISKATKRNFIIDDKVRGKITIISEKMMTRSEAYQAFLSALQVTGFTVVEGPGGVLKIVGTREAIQYPIPTHVDTTPYTDSFITRLIKMENISATDMQSAIKGLVSKDGNIFAYPETNTLVITDSGTNIDRLMKIMKELDQEGPQQIVDIVKLQYANAKELVSIVNSLYEQQKQGPGGGARKEGLPEVEEVSKLIADDRTNSIIIMASKRAIDKVKALINKLDARLEEGAEGHIHVHYLKHAKAKEIAEVLQTLSGVASKSPAAGGANKANESVIAAELDDFKVAADEMTNSLLITSTPKTYNTLVDRVISKLDIPQKQVYLEAVVMEFALNKSSNIGVQAHGGAGIGGMLPFGQDFGSIAHLFSPEGFFQAPGLLGGLLSRQTVDVQLPTTGGDLKTTQIPAFGAFVTALQSIGDTNIVSTPNLLTLDNVEATIDVTRKEPRPGQQTLTPQGGTLNQPVEYEEAGLKMKIKPQITEGDNVKLDIENELSSFDTAQDPSLKAPAKVVRKIKTAVLTSDGQTVVLGGLMEDKVNNKKSKVPLLGDIPLLGFLFRQTETHKSKSNLLIFLTPHVIHDTGDFMSVLKRKVDERNEFFDQNLSRKQQRDARDLIKSHRADLLEVKMVPGGGQSFNPPSPEAGKKEAAVSGPAPPVITVAPTPPVSAPQSPVIAPPPASNKKPSSGQDIDLAY